MATTTTQYMDIDMHLSQLLGTMSLIGTRDIAKEKPLPVQPIIGNPDASMSDLSDTEDSTLPSDHLECSSTSRDCGCAYLQAIRSQVCSGLFPTTGGEYLEAIFTHREAFSAYPPGHRDCAIALSDLAEDLARRASRADRDGDSEAVAAFRYEAVVIAHSL